MSSISPSQAVFNFLKTNVVFPFTVKQLGEGLSGLDQRIYHFIRCLPLFFGRQNIPQIARKLEARLSDELENIGRVYHEVSFHDWMDYTTGKLESTTKCVGKYRPSNLSDEEFFIDLQKDSYATLSFLQYVRCRSAYDVKYVEELEDRRRRGVALIGRFCTVPDASLTEDEELLVTQTMFSAVAMMRAGKPVSYAEFLEFWALKRPKARQDADRLMEQLKAAHWLSGQDDRCVSSRGEEKDVAFRDALRAETIQEAQNVLGIPFSPQLIAYLNDKTCDETFRLDFEFFLTHLGLLQTRVWMAAAGPSEDEMRSLERIMELGWAGPQSKSLFTSIELYLHVVRICGVAKDKKPALLEMIIHRDKRWDPSTLPDWSLADKWRRPSGAHTGTETPIFTRGWAGVNLLIEKLKKKDSLLMNPHLWPLLSFFITNEDAVKFITLFGQLSIQPEVSLSPTIAYRFCQENAQSGGSLAEFANIYLGALAVLRPYPGQLTAAESIYLDPPLSLSKDIAILRATSDRLREFLQFMGRYRLDMNGQILRLLNTYLFHPTPGLYALAGDASVLSSHPLTEDHFFEALSISDGGLFAENASPAARKVAQEIVANLGKQMPFSGPELFSIYLEMIRLRIAKQDHVLRAIAKVIFELEHFCGPLGKDQIYFLHRYHPDISTEEIRALSLLRTRLRSTNRDQFVLDQSLIDEIYTSIELFCEKLASPAQEKEAKKGPFISSMQNFLSTAFFPPIQPLIDHFRISGLSVDEGIRWQSSHLVSHLGQHRPMFKGGSLAIYLHWDMVSDRPVFFMSFSHLGKGTSGSAFIGLDLPLGVRLQSPRRRYSFGEEDIPEEDTLKASSAAASSHTSSSSSSSSSSVAPVRKNHRRALSVMTSSLLPKEEGDGKRQALFSYLYRLLSVFNERTNGHEPNTETVEEWLACYTGVADDLQFYHDQLTPPERQKIWNFVKEVKVTYRRLFLLQTGGSEAEIDPKLSSLQIASQGTIYLAAPRGSLIPEFLARIEPHMEFYTPDASEGHVDGLRTLFAKRLPAFRDIKMKLTVTDGTQKIECPVTCRVQTLVDLLPAPIGREEDWDGHALPFKEASEQSYVTLQMYYGGRPIRMPLSYSREVLQDPRLFRQHFDYHNLILKARYYYEIEHSQKGAVRISSPLS